MSQLHRYEIEVWPVEPGSPHEEEDADAIGRAIPFEVDSHMYQGNHLVFFGEHSISGAGPDAQDEIIDALEAVGYHDLNVVSRWRNIEFDEWDHVCGEDDEDDE